jgi:hypothetical protein
MKKITMPAILFLCIVFFISAIPVALSPDKDKSEVFVLATLYSRHKTTPVYNLDTLQKIIRAIDPDVFVLDVTPTELKERQVWPSKIEYPGAIFPLINGNRHAAYPAEPPEPMFTEIVNSVKEIRENFKSSRPDVAQTLDDLTNNLFEALKASWQTPADVNSKVTDLAIDGKRLLEDKLRGPEDEENGNKWTQHIINVTLQAAKEHPGKRILVLNGLENCYLVKEGLSRHAGITVVDMEAWLRQHP